MAPRRKRDQWTTADLIALAVGVFGGGALYITGLIHLADWLTADLLRAVVALAVLGGVALLWCVTGLLAALLVR